MSSFYATCNEQLEKRRGPQVKFRACIKGTFRPQCGNVSEISCGWTDEGKIKLSGRFEQLAPQVTTLAKDATAATNKVPAVQILRCYIGPLQGQSRSAHWPGQLGSAVAAVVGRKTYTPPRLFLHIRQNGCCLHYSRKICPTTRVGSCHFGRCCVRRRS